MSLGLYNGTLYRFQAEIVANAYLRPRNIAIVDTGLGKGLEVGTGVLRPDGTWTPVQDLAVGDLVIGGDGHPVMVEGVFDRGVQPGYRVTTDDGVSINVDADHLWTVATDLDISRGIPWRTLDTRTLAESVDAPGRKRWRIPVTAHHGGGGSLLPIDPYVLGVLLGDGHICGGQVGFVSVDEDIVSMVKERLPDGVEMRVDLFQSKPTRYRLVGSTFRQNPMLEAVRALGLHGCRSWEKFVPEVYLRSSEEDRRALLAGLMDTDGWVGSAQQFTSTSERLAQDVAYLARSLGGVARVTTKQTSHRTAYNVSVRLDRCPFWMERKVDRWEQKPRLGVTRKIATIEPIVGGIHSVCIKVASEDGLFVTEGFVVTHNTHLALALIALSIEDDLIDRAIVVVEGNKVDEWMADIDEFTQLSAVKYRGESKARKKRLLKRRDSQVVVSTYQTLREDLVEGKKFDPGFLMQTFEGERLLIIYDEVTVLGGRTSRTHQVHRFFAHTFDARLLGLTATPVTSGAESYYNLGRIFCPDLVGTVEQFHREHVVRFDSFHNPAQYRNLELLAEKMAPVILRKRKTDPDVVDQFPKTVEDFVKVQLNEDHRKLYDDLEALCEELSEEQLSPAFQLLCAFANHPRSIFSSQSTIAQMFLERHTHEEITKVVCAKTESVLRKMKAVTDQGDQAVVFCNSVQVLDELYADAVAKGLSVARYHGGLSNDTREANKTAFKAGQVKILLCSAAGERGINLPEASYIINYDVPTMHSSYIQRLSRASRIGSNAGEILVVVTYVAAGTAEEGSVRAWNKRNAQSDTLIDFDVDPADEYFTSASDRKHMIKEASKR